MGAETDDTTPDLSVLQQRLDGQATRLMTLIRLLILSVSAVAAIIKLGSDTFEPTVLIEIGALSVGGSISACVAGVVFAETPFGWPASPEDRGAYERRVETLGTIVAVAVTTAMFGVGLITAGSVRTAGLEPVLRSKVFVVVGLAVVSFGAGAVSYRLAPRFDTARESDST